ELEMASGSLSTLAVGLSVGDGTRVRLVATAGTDSAAHTVGDALLGFFRLAADKLAEEKEHDRLGTFGMAPLKKVTFHRDGRRLTVALTADGNVVKMILAAMLNWL